VSRRDRPLLARAIDGTACRFRTSHDVDLWPLTIVDTRLDESVARSPKVSVQLDLFEAGRAALADPTAAALLPPPHRRVGHRRPHAVADPPPRWVTVLSGTSVVARLPPTSVAAPAVRGRAVLPWLDTAPQGYRSVLELFALPEKFCFFELTGLHDLGLGDQRLDAAIRVRPPAAAAGRADPTTFRLHCTPAINLFEAPGEPIVRGPRTREALVRADGVDPRHMEVYEVRGVTAVSRTHGAAAASSRSRAPATSPAAPAPSFALRRVRSPRSTAASTLTSR
jgi:type VI secretion system protein ImpG